MKNIKLKKIFLILKIFTAAVLVNSLGCVFASDDIVVEPPKGYLSNSVRKINSTWGKTRGE